ncbi:glycosyltransferase [Pontibacter korlensis]|uniref:glycosyltransferase n=1 Tax=Pontibacter korlensis TaxID=400092 RepID=UPI0009FF827B
MFSFIIPLYNKEQTIASAMESVLNQTRKEYEVLVVNDGTTNKKPSNCRVIPRP